MATRKYLITEILFSRQTFEVLVEDGQDAVDVLMDNRDDGPDGNGVVRPLLDEPDVFDSSIESVMEVTGE